MEAEVWYDGIVAGAFTAHGPAGESFSWAVKAVRHQPDHTTGADQLAFAVTEPRVRGVSAPTDPQEQP
ncbi:hypothetical protein [Sinomonas notoginsengisoli]|uniref:hypothetical protein n=1 Tax=Sinomonas notoginsengisoli TaxID=1457311 RepID=UPI001F3219BA|nr:hypothetical protein [Sinomonas notoginsengisoli]